MGLYARYVLPWLLDCSCGVEAVRTQREHVVPRARGRVLEVGIGSGHNIAFYDPARVEKLWGLDPAVHVTGLAARRAARSPLTIELIGLSGEAIPLIDASMDTVVMTYTLCSIPDPGRALAEVRRVLRPDGELMFCEHGLSPDAKVRRRQDRLTPLWSRIAGGCHLNRPIRSLIEQAGFIVYGLHTEYLSGPKPLTYHYRGYARVGPVTHPQ